MTLANEFDLIKEDLLNIKKALYDHPELGDEEYESMKLLVDYLREHDFKVETGLVNRPTSFRAEFTSGKPGPTIAYLAEYDALPGIGHGCGHNLIATMSTGAGIILSKVINEIGGRVIVLGTPAEETNGAKVPMVKQGIFDDIDVAMMAHPFGESTESGPMLAIDAIQFAFTGKSAHAAAAPEQGINALDSVIQLFNGINAIREHVPSDVKMHGVISKGGQAANIVPDYAVAQYYFRSNSRDTLDQVVAKAKKIAEGAALMTGATVEISNYEISYDNLITNQTLSSCFTKNMKEISQQPVQPPRKAAGSADIGDVSRVVPAIHPMIGLNDASLVLHTTEVADKTITKDGDNALMYGALSLAKTGNDVITNPDLLSKIKKEFQNSK